MENSSGIFECPMCKKGSFKYKRWMKKTIYSHNRKTFEWIFYDDAVNNNFTFYEYIKQDSIFKCFFGFSYCTWPQNNCNCDCFKGVLKNLGLYLITALSFIFYISIYIWIDLIKYFCFSDKRKKIYKNVFGNDVEIKDIWESNLGKKEEDIYKSQDELKSNFTCKNCKYVYSDFKNCISCDDDKSEISILSSKSNINEKSNKILINISIPEGGYNIKYYHIYCKKDTKFKFVIKKVGDEYSHYKFRKLIFLLGNKKMNENKTIVENGIKNGDNIFFNDITS